jgi:hypothetical protein
MFKKVHSFSLSISYYIYIGLEISKTYKSFIFLSSTSLLFANLAPFVHLSFVHDLPPWTSPIASKIHCFHIKSKVPSIKGLVLCNSGRLPTVTTVALPLSFGWLFSNSRGASLKGRIAKAIEWRHKVIYEELA